MVPHAFDSVKGLVFRNINASAIAINWAIFGSNGHIDYIKDLCINAFTRRSVASLGTNKHYKCIINTRAMRSITSVHGVGDNEGVVRPDGSAFKTQKPGKMLCEANFDICQINHYFTRSKADWIDKLSRGYRDGTKRNLDDFSIYDHNQVEDHSAGRFSSEVRKLISQYLGHC